MVQILGIVIIVVCAFFNDWAGLTFASLSFCPKYKALVTERCRAVRKLPSWILPLWYPSVQRVSERTGKSVTGTSFHVRAKRVILLRAATDTKMGRWGMPMLAPRRVTVDIYRLACQGQCSACLAVFVVPHWLYYIETTKSSPLSSQCLESPKVDQMNNGNVVSSSVESKMSEKNGKNKKVRKQPKEWGCVDRCCWLLGYVFIIWWLLCFVYNLLPTSLLPGFVILESPGERLKKEGVTALHPVVLVPGFVTGGLELWEGKPCAESMFRKKIWGGNFGEILKRPLCWIEHLSLHNESGLDPPGIRVRPVPGLAGADYFGSAYYVWAVLIENLAKIGYEEKNMYMAVYDWRISFQNTEIRDKSLTRLKSHIELMYVTNGYRKVVVVPHSMGVLYFLHFLKWVEAPPPMGGGGGPGWCDKHIKAMMNVGPTFLGVPRAVSMAISAEGKDVASIRSMANGLLDSEYLGLQPVEHIMRLSRTWDSTLSLLPKGGETIWGNLDWSPEEHNCDQRKSSATERSCNDCDNAGDLKIKKPMKFGRMISFGKESWRLPSSQLPSVLDLKDDSRSSASAKSNLSCEVWTEYDEMSQESIRKIAENKIYTATTILDLLRFIGPKTMRRAEAHYSHGIAENLDDLKYDHYKYWSNPLETKLPDAPEMEIFCLYGVGLPTERAYIYKTSISGKCKSIPFRIDNAANGDDYHERSCLKNGVFFVDGDESVPVVSAGFMCAKGWRGKTRFNPSGSPTYVREYQHRSPASLFDGRGTESGRHVDIMGNVALIEDILRVAAGATGSEIGGDRIYSDLITMSERINLP